jgi:hypothetical protein
LVPDTLPLRPGEGVADTGVPGGQLVNPTEGVLGEQVRGLVDCVNEELVRNGGVSYIEQGRTDEAAYLALVRDAQVLCATTQN